MFPLHKALPARVLSAPWLRILTSASAQISAPASKWWANPTHIRKLIIVDCPSSLGPISNRSRSSNYFPHSFSPGFRIAMAAQKKTWISAICQSCFKNHQSKTIFTSSIMLNSMSSPCYSEKLSSGDMLKPDPSFRPNPPKVLSRGQNHPPNHLARICCFLFIHWSIKCSLTSGSIPMW